MISPSQFLFVYAVSVFFSLLWLEIPFVYAVSVSFSL